MVGLFEPCVYVLVCSDAVGVLLGGNGFDKDGVATMESDRYVLVATVGLGMEESSVICEQVGDR